jgi:predicted dehydrogenase
LRELQLAVAGVGAFGKNHLRILRELPGVKLAAVVDTDAKRARATGLPFFADVRDLPEGIDAAVVAVPTKEHARVGCALLERGIDVLVEKPIAFDLASARQLADTATRNERLLQVGHLERFNPAVQALASIVKLPLFFEVHRMSLFSPRSLDIDVVLDLMIHDIDVILSLTGAPPEEIRAAGIRILSGKVDIANVRLAFPGGCIANLTASRVSTEKVRKIRVFQPQQYISVDYERQDVAAFTVSSSHEIAFLPVGLDKQEPLRAELESFVECVRTRRPPLVGAADGIQALEVALAILKHIEIHAEVVANTLSRHGSSTASS